MVRIGCGAGFGGDRIDPAVISVGLHCVAARRGAGHMTAFGGRALVNIVGDRASPVSADLAQALLGALLTNGQEDFEEALSDCKKWSG